MKWLHRYAVLVVCSTVLLIAAGGMVTSTGSGLAVPDWPNTYGSFMFAFPLDKMVGGIFYEHGHRMIASAVGFLTIILAVWIWRVDPRPWMRRLGVVALGAVILQGLLGGLTVLLLLPAPISIGHAGLAQLFFCSTVAIAVFTSRGWRASAGAIDRPRLRSMALMTTIVIYVQILLGATMRHNGAGLAIPDFPLAFGGIVPSSWNAGVAIHFAHRIGALVVFFAILATAIRVWRDKASESALARPAALLVFLVLVQGTLGAYVVWSGLQPVINTAHVANGALLLGTSLVLTLRSHRARFSESRVDAAHLRPTGFGEAAAGARP
ncbi:MAG: COX15/CtaA family protein [Acidobacteria bacterium]|nr:COX15/CtaA family protein [Acidobacteriota bacterium]